MMARDTIDRIDQGESDSSTIERQARAPKTSARLKTLLAALPSLITPPKSADLEKFTLFPKLPRELRNRIWLFAASEPRLVKFPEMFSDIKYAWPRWNSNVKGQLRQPGIMGACRESRAEGARVYELIYEHERQVSVKLKEKVLRSGITKPARTIVKVCQNAHWVNYNVDVFYMPYMLDAIEGKLFNPVRGGRTSRKFAIFGREDVAFKVQEWRFHDLKLVEEHNPNERKILLLNICARKVTAGYPTPARLLGGIEKSQGSLRLQGIPLAVASETARWMARLPVEAKGEKWELSELWEVPRFYWKKNIRFLYEPWL